MERKPDGMSDRLKIGMVLFGLAVGLPGLVLFTDTEDDPAVLPVCAAVAVLGSAVAFAVGAERRLLAVAPGLVAGAGAFAALVAYLAQRDEVRKLELVIPIAFGSLPGLGLYWLLRKVVPTRPLSVFDADDDGL